MELMKITVYKIQGLTSTLFQKPQGRIPVNAAPGETLKKKIHTAHRHFLALPTVTCFSHCTEYLQEIIMTYICPPPPNLPYPLQQQQQQQQKSADESTRLLITFDINCKFCSNVLPLIPVVCFYINCLLTVPDCGPQCQKNESCCWRT